MQEFFGARGRQELTHKCPRPIEKSGATPALDRRSRSRYELAADARGILR